MVSISRNTMPFLLLIAVALSLAVGGELSGEFDQIRRFALEPQDILSVAKADFFVLHNGFAFWLRC